MKKFLKYLYRWCNSLFLKRRGIIIRPSALYNQRSIFEGANVVHKGACVSSSIVGYGTYVGENTFLPNCLIGRFCSIASNVKVVVATHPTSKFVSTSPMFFSTLKQSGGNDVWIGENAMIKGGIRIGDGAIVAMGACVTKDVPPYAIVGGVPAKIIRYRFTEEQINYLKDLQWWNKPLDWIERNASDFENISEFSNKHSI